MSDERLVAGRYRLAQVSGRGAAGVVWEATDEMIGRQVAVKELRAPAGLTEEQRAALTKRALREARNAGKLNHRGVVKIHDIVPATDADDAIYLVMELVEGPTLADVLRHEGALPEARVIAMGLQLLDVLEAARAMNVVHRDIKPGNIMVLPGDRVKLVDFSIAHATDDTRLTREGVLGSTGYLAPELFHGEDPGPASDLWSLGATLFHAIEGSGPFEHDSTAATMHAVLYDELPAPRCGPPLATVITGMLTRDRRQRITGAQAVALLRPAGSTPNAAPAWEANPTTVNPTVKRPKPAEPVPSSGARRDGWLTFAGVLCLLGSFTTAGLVISGTPLYGVAAFAPVRVSPYEYTITPYVMVGLALLLFGYGIALFVKRIQATLGAVLAGTAAMWTSTSITYAEALSPQQMTDGIGFSRYLLCLPMAVASLIAVARVLRKLSQRRWPVTAVADLAGVIWFVLTIRGGASVVEMLALAPTVVGIPVLATMIDSARTGSKVLVGWILGLGLEWLADLIMIAYFRDWRSYVSGGRELSAELPTVTVVYAWLTAVAIAVMVVATVLLARAGRKSAFLPEKTVVRS